MRGSICWAHRGFDRSGTPESRCLDYSDRRKFHIAPGQLNLLQRSRGWRRLPVIAGFLHLYIDAKAPGIDRAFQATLDYSAKVVQTIDLGNRLPVSGVVDENILGDALHAIFAAEFTNPQHPERMIAIKRILGAYNLDQSIKTDDVALMLDCFAAQLDKLFQPKTILVETPFLSVNSHGQRTSGYIDLLLETSKGAVIIDHKSFLGKRADWPAKALSYSGQLAAYRDAQRTRRSSPRGSISRPEAGSCRSIGDCDT